MATRVYQKKNGQLVLVLTDTSDEVTALQEGMSEVRETTDASVTSISVSGQTLVLTHGDGTQSDVDTGFITSASVVVATAELGLPTPITAGTVFDISNYVVGSNTVSVFIDGARAERGVVFSEIGTEGSVSSQISIDIDIPEYYEVVVVTEISVNSGSDTGGIAHVVAEEVIATPITSGENVTVPAYIVGSRTLNIFVDGILASRNVTYTEVGDAGAESTTITFAGSISEGVEVIVTVG